MNNINSSRVVLGGLAAGALIWIVEGVASVFYMNEMNAALTAHSLSMDMGAKAIVLSLAVSIIVGLTIVFFYAAARSRFGPGPKTAVIVAIALWMGGYFVSLLGYEMMGIFPRNLLVIWGTVGLAEMIVAAILGGWIYRET